MKLKEIREAKKIKQADIAKKCGIRRETMWAIERGKCSPSVKVALMIAKELDSTVEELFDEDY